MSERPEDEVLAAINELERDGVDELVDRQMSVPFHRRSGYDNNVNQQRCSTCREDWHGLPNAVTGCPEAFARGYQKREWKRKRGNVGPRDFSRYASPEVYVRGMSWQDLGLLGELG